MDKNGFIMVGIGEVLWDMLPSGKKLGGAVANFAYHASVLGNRGVIASAVGNDDLGKELVENLKTLGLETDFIQTDDIVPTGTVVVELDPKGQPTYIISEDVAWDYLGWDDKWETLARQADAICFGSLCQRWPTSYHTIKRFVRAAKNECLRIFDVNLRQNFYTADKINDSMQMADIVKLNEAEIGHVFRMLGLKPTNLRASAKQLLENFGLKMVCLTRDQRGCMLVTEKQTVEHPGFKIKLTDAVGAGDAFTAALAHHYLRGTSLDKIAEAANRLGAYVASKAGATPQIDKNTLNLVLSPQVKRPDNRPSSGGRPGNRQDNRPGGRPDHRPNGRSDQRGDQRGGFRNQNPRQ